MSSSKSQSISRSEPTSFHQSTSEHNPPPPPPPPPPQSFFVQALYAYSGADTASLSFRQGDLIEVLSTLESGWWDGVICQEKVRGWFPSNYVQRVTEEEAEWAREQMISWYDEDEENSRRTSETLAEDGREVRNNGSRRRKESFSSSNSNSNENDSLDEERNRKRPESSQDDHSSLDHEGVEEEDFWVPKVMTTGQLFYYNSRTGETSRDMPINGRGDGVQIDHEDYPVDEEEGELEENHPQYHEGRKLEGDWKAVKVEDGNRYYYENVKSGVKTWSPPSSPSDIIKETIHSRSRDVRRNSNYSDESALEGNFGDSTRSKNLPPPPSSSNSLETKVVESFQPPVTPLLVDLDGDVTKALKDLVAEAGMGAMIRQGGEERNFEKEREKLSKLSDNLVTSVRNLLISSGALESATSSTDLPPSAASNQLSGAIPFQPLPPSSAYLALRPYTRQVTTGLSKLLMPIRAIWGTLETIPSDKVLDSIEDESLLDESERLNRLEERKILVESWSSSNDARIETEARLRSQLLSEATDLQGFVADFLSHYEEILLADYDGKGPIPSRSTLRTSRCLKGSLKSISTDKILDQSFGGNWRGQGFVTLPTLASESALTSAYNYPAIPLTKTSATSVMEESKILSQQVEEFKALITSNSSLQTSSFSSELIKQSSRIGQSIGAYLSTIENINIATHVDIISSAKVSDVKYTKYRASIQEAIKLMTVLENGKQSLYDVAHDLLFIVQAMFINSSSTTSRQLNGAQPLSNSPLVSFHNPSKSRKDPKSILDALSDIYSASLSTSKTIASLYAIAELQSFVPLNLRTSSAVARPVSPTISTTASSTFTHHKTTSTDRTEITEGEEGEDDKHDEDEDAGSSGGDSVDSDFFFPAGGTRSSPASVRTRASSKAAQFFGSPVAIPNWEKRRSSNATSTSSLNSDSYSFRPRLMSTDEDMSHSSPTKSPSSKAKLAKLLGADSVNGRNIAMPAVKEPTPVWLLPDYEQDSISFNMEGQVKGGTLKALVIAAASHEGRVDSNYLSAFLMTYRTFCTAHQLLDILIQRFLIPAPPGLSEQQITNWETLKLRPIRARVSNVIKSWVRDHMDHDEFDPGLLRKIASFASTTMKDPVQSPQIIKAVEDRLSGAAPRQNGNLAPGSLPPSLIPRNTRKLKFTDVDPLELARQLTIMDGRLFSKITPQECLGKAWPKEYGSEAPHITAMIGMSNAVTRWVTETVLAQDDLKKRANTIKHFIYVAERCLALNNFSTLIHIIAGLNSTPVNRLRRTWETVSQKSMISLGILNSVMKQEKNYKEYRERLRAVTPPCVPFLGVYLTDWTFIGDGNADMLREKPHQINFQKRQKATELILMIKLHQSTTYNLAAVPVIVKWLNEQMYPPDSDPTKDDQRLYEISLTREPRERDDEKIARLLSESGFL